MLYNIYRRVVADFVVFLHNQYKGDEMKKFALIGKIFLFVLYFIVIIMGLTVAILLICGMKLYCIETGSMEPNYPIGSMVVVERVYLDQLKEGDVITYVISDNTVVTHRLIGIDLEHRLLSTKGDNNDVADASPVNFENVIGRVSFCVPAFGYVFLFLSTRFGKIMLGILALGFVGVHIIMRMYYKMSDDEKEQDTEEHPENDGSEVEKKDELKDEGSGTL